MNCENSIKNRCLLVKIIYIILIGICFQACDKLEAREEAEIGKEALLNCEFGKAKKHFDKAHDLYPSHEEILIGLAFSEIADYASNEEMDRMLSRLGVEKTLTEYCIEKRDAEDAKVESTDAEEKKECKILELSSFKSSSSASPVLSLSTSDIDPELTWTDVWNILLSQNEQLVDAAEHFQRIAVNLGDDSWHTDMFGYENIGFHKADFAAFASIFYLTAAAVTILSDYQLGFNVKDSVEAYQNGDDDKLSQYINAFLFVRNTAESQAPEAQNLIYEFVQSLFLFSEGVGYLSDLYRKIGKQLEDGTEEKPEEFDIYTEDGCLKRRALFHWENTKPGIQNDIYKASQVFVESETVMTLDNFLAPSVQLDIAYLLSHLPSRTTDASILFIDDGDWKWALQAEISQINQAFTLNVFDEDEFTLDSEFSYRLNSAWLKFCFEDWL